MIRPAKREDVPAILNIYAPYVRETTITFEYDVPEITGFYARFDSISGRYPYLVWEEGGRILGYAYADRAFARAAYAWDADLSIYLDMNERGRGVGTKLYGCLEEIMKNHGYHNLYALITGENAASVRFHESRGYGRLGVLKDSGWKFGRWLDVYWYGLRLRPAENPGNAPGAFVYTDDDIAAMVRHSKEG